MWTMRMTTLGQIVIIRSTTDSRARRRDGVLTITSKEQYISHPTHTRKRHVVRDFMKISKTNFHVCMQISRLISILNSCTTDLFGFLLCLFAAVAQSSVAPCSPGEELLDGE